MRAFYLVHVSHPTEPKVYDVGGSTVEARWFPAAEVFALDLINDVTDVTADALTAAAAVITASKIPAARKPPRKGRSGSIGNGGTTG